MLLDRPGRSHVVLAAVLFLLASLVIGSITMALGTTKPLVLVVRLALAFGLAVAMLKGANWARWVIAVLGGAAGLWAGITTWSGFATQPLGASVFLGAFAAYYLGLAAFLAFSPSLGAYFREPMATMTPSQP